MKLLFYKSLVLFLAFTGSVLGQKYTVLNESFDVGFAKVLELDLKNIPLTISPSLDNKVHIDFTMDFKGFTKQEIKSKLNKVYFEKVISPNDVKLSIKSETTISPSHFFSTKGIVIDNAKDFVSLSNNMGEKKEKRKSKADIINEIRTTPLEEESFLSQITKQIENDKDAQVQKARFFIRIPKKLQLKIKAQGVRLTSEIAESKDLKLEMNGSSFKARKLSDANISITNASLKIEEIESGSYNLKDVSKCLIGSIKNTFFESETSKIEIGEVLENVSFSDYNSDYYLFNFSKKFKKFDFRGLYSEIHFFEPKTDYSLEVFGHDTTFYFDNNTVISQPSKDGKTKKMMDRKLRKDKPFSGKLEFTIIHSNFYYPTEFTPNKNN